LGMESFKFLMELTNSIVDYDLGFKM